MNTSTARQECATLSLYTTSRTTDTAPMLSFTGCQNSTALTSLHCSIRSRVEVNFVDVCGFDARRGSPELQQVRLPVRFSRRRLRFSLPILLYCCTRIQYVALAIILSDSCERMRRDKIPPQRMHAACRIVTRGSCCTKRFAEFNGNCESYCSLEQLVASLSAADERKSASGTYHPKTEGYYTRRHLRKPPGLLYCGECTWTRLSRRPIIEITWHFSQQTLLEPLTVTGACASCFGERYRDVLYQNLDENNNTQTSRDCCTVVLRT